MWLSVVLESTRCIVSVVVCRVRTFFFSFAYTTSPAAVMKLVVFFFFFSFAYTTSPAAVMKLVVFFRSSKPPYHFWWSGVADGHCAIRSGWCLLPLWRTWLSGPPHHRYTLRKERFLVSCACVRWACCGRNTDVPKSPGRACQESGMHPSHVCVSALFWW